ncbi:two-component system, OmpR family, response regulator MtrA [Propionibacterium sp. oral taxon 192 str. F0372]|uniref:MtrAB system response regulator MtrA n=1 Tax=Propionibacterium sp. oral taxon 192 TaxID=671222 RepID=UPI0003532659|nr:MtrAB system response regulator MtrA [Propionibacterium sp. oral taxon 192]EPH00368.1 two-component system, OmpR family, response regulator MtrA [Propionibacterium sp. oral taxon 192 str. F0372]
MGEAQRERILVVDDDTALAEMLQIMLRQEGFDTSWCATGDRAFEAFEAFEPSLVLLDVMLPGMDGIRVCRAIRRVSGVPIIMLTARSDTTDVVRGLEEGADDYVAKPFKTKELVARMRARLRTPGPPTESDVLSIGDLVISTRAHTVTRGEESINLTPLEFDLLVALAKTPGQVMTREQLLSDVWGYRHAADTRLVNVHVQRLRAKVEKDPENPEIIVTVRGVGYRAGAPSHGDA